MTKIKPRVLLVEDDKQLCKALKTRLHNDYQIDYTHNVEDCIRRVHAEEYELYLIDLALSGETGKDGLELCKHIRNIGIHAPIIILTGKTAINYKIKAFKIGINDYICKPFNTLELQARMRTWLKFIEEDTEETILRYHDIEIDAKQHTVTREGKNIPLRRKELELLAVLVKNKNCVLTREIISAKLALSDESCSNTVDVHIRNLRKKVDAPFKRKIIRTVHGIGYGLR